MLFGLGGVSTMAGWTASASVSAGEISSSSLDITINNTLWGPNKQDGIITFAAWRILRIMPGESFAIAFTVRNYGPTTADVRIQAYGNSTGAPALALRLYADGSPINTPTNSFLYPPWEDARHGVCQGGTEISPSWVRLDGATGFSTRATLDTAPRRMLTGDAQSYCAIFALQNDPDVWNDPSLTNTATGLTIVANGVQVQP